MTQTALPLSRTVDKNIETSNPWNKHLPVPLRPNETVYVHPDQDGIADGYLRIIHGVTSADAQGIAAGVVSVFSEDTLNGPKFVPVSAFAPRAVSSYDELEQIDDSLEMPAPQKTTKKEKAEAPKSGIEFAGVIYKQSRAVLAVVERYVKDHPGSTVADVEKAFPETLLRRFGIVRTPDRAKSISSGPRYFYNNPVRCADGEVVVCTQFTSENIKPFIKHANEMGYTLTVINRSSSSEGIGRKLIAQFTLNLKS